jgi:hypothetical protein
MNTAKIEILAILTLLAMTPGCRTPGGTTTTTTPTAVVDCAVKSVTEVAKDNLPRVEQILTSGDWEAQLGAVVKDLGVEAVACIIDHIVHESHKDLMASSDENAKLKVSRGEKWISDNQISFKTN